MIHILALILVALTASLVAQEKATFTSPATTSVTFVEIQRIDVQRKPDFALRIYYTDSTGKEMLDDHNGLFVAAIAAVPDNPATVGVDESVPANPGNPNGADVLVKSLNKANLTLKSLERRALEHLVSEGKIPASSITGTPQ